VTVNPITGIESTGIPFDLNLNATAMKPGQAQTGPQFLMPAEEGVIRLPSVLKLRTLYTPVKDAKDLAESLTHIVGIPIKPMKCQSDHTITVTTFLGYAPAGLAAVGAKDTFLTEPGPEFKTLLDMMRDTFISMFLKDGVYDLGAGPKRTDLEDWLTECVANLGGLKEMARRMNVPENIVATTFVVGNSDVVLPATYDTGSKASTITVKVKPEDAIKLKPQYFQTTAPRLAYISWQQVCNYFDLGEQAPLIIAAMFETYGKEANPVPVASFLETVMTQVNSTGKYAYGVIPSSTEAKARSSSAAALVYEMFEQIILFLAFSELSKSLDKSSLVSTVTLKWENEFADEYAVDVIGNDAAHMEYIGCPNDDEGGAEIASLPYFFWKEGSEDSLPDTAGEYYKLCRLRTKPVKTDTWFMSCSNFAMPTVGWQQQEGKTIGLTSIHAEFDAQVGLTCDTNNPNFLDIVVRGDIYAGWQRDRPFDSPQLWRLGISRNQKPKFSIGLGPMTLLDPIVGRKGVFGGNIVPFDVGKARGTAMSVLTGGQATYAIDPAKVLARSVEKKADGKVN
jgi:hypothetical protein